MAKYTREQIAQLDYIVEGVELYESDGNTRLRQIVAKLKEAKTLCDQFAAAHPEDCPCEFCDKITGNMFQDKGDLNREIVHTSNVVNRLIEPLGNDLFDDDREERIDRIIDMLNRDEADEPAVA